ncbi:hypothetical protein DY000_02011817 [Brassica cretica]|uniref:Uncharacterized protein n=1 Tax=Brassica cretica TaxID=69181 RepID=A0ABQ7CX42_BRACR|nr:hypothetical protein DY000_02011817 [Brassica cretica]
MGASDSTLLGGQEKGGGDVITTISQRCERVDPILENLKSLTISRPIPKTAPPTESSLTDILVRKALSSSSSSYTVDPQILVELFSIYREWQDSKAEDITNRQLYVHKNLCIFLVNATKNSVCLFLSNFGFTNHGVDALASKLLQRFNHSVSAMRTTSHHLSQGAYPISSLVSVYKIHVPDTRLPSPLYLTGANIFSSWVAGGAWGPQRKVDRGDQQLRYLM